MAERKPGFIYMFSDTLKQEIAFNIKTGTVWCQDGVKYSPEEIAVIAENGGAIPPQVHAVKKIFQGSKVARYERGKQDGTGDPENDTVNSSAGGEIPKDPGGGEGSKDGELDFY